MPALPQPLPEAAAAPLAPAIRATRLIFLLSGLAMAGWAPMVPYVKARLDLDDATLGLVLLAFGGGSMASMPLVGALIHRHGSRRVIVASGLLICLALPWLAGVGSLPALVAALLYFGVMLGAVDVAMNAHAVEVEQRAGRPLMSGFHGLFSVGGLAGALLMSALLAAGLPLLAASGALSLALLLIVLGQWRRLLPDPPLPATGGTGARWRLPRGPVWLIGALCFVCFMAEGALLDWSALLLRDVRGMAPAVAGTGYAVFSVAMAAGRLTGDAVVARLGHERTVRWGGGLAAAGFLLAAALPWAASSLLGFALIGLGASNIVPVLFGAAGRLPGLPASIAIATATMVGYTGLLCGPALIGLIAHATSLPLALGLIAVLLTLVALSARVVRR